MKPSLPKEGQPPFGGGEVGNLRTLKMLRNAGYEVVCIRHRRSDARWGIIRTLMSHPFRLLGGWGETFFKLLFAPRISLVHLSGFAGKTILNEYVLMHIVKNVVISTQIIAIFFNAFMSLCLVPEVLKIFVE